MTNTNLFNDAVKRSGIKNKALAEKLGLSAYGLARKANNLNEFKASEIATCTHILGLTREERDAIFLPE